MWAQAPHKPFTLTWPITAAKAPSPARSLATWRCRARPSRWPSAFALLPALPADWQAAWDGRAPLPLPDGGAYIGGQFTNFNGQPGVVRGPNDAGGNATGTITGQPGDPIAGFNITGTGTKKLLVRAVGPTLAAFGVEGVLANPGVEKLDFELWSTAVSAINGCGACLDAHEGELRKHGVPNVQVQAALRIGAVVHAASRIVASEAALAG